MISNKINIVFVTLVLLFAACDSIGSDTRFTDNPLSRATTPKEGVLDKQEQKLWNFDSMEGWITANQGNDPVNHASIEGNIQCSD